jgi:hypothetical protein
VPWGPSVWHTDTRLRSLSRPRLAGPVPRLVAGPRWHRAPSTGEDTCTPTHGEMGREPHPGFYAPQDGISQGSLHASHSALHVKVAPCEARWTLASRMAPDVRGP